jgi:hypothetical protein
MHSKLSLILLQLIRMSDNSDRNMKCEKFCSQLSTYFKRHINYVDSSTNQKLQQYYEHLRTVTRFLLKNSNRGLKLNYTPWLWSASELYRPSDRHLAKLVPTFANRGCDICLFIFISTTYIIKFSIYLCSKAFCLLGLTFALLICIIT